MAKKKRKKTEAELQWEAESEKRLEKLYELANRGFTELEERRKREAQTS